MSDHIDDKELEELNEIYRRKMESQKSHEPKKAKHEKPVRAAKSEDTHSVKAPKGKKSAESVTLPPSLSLHGTLTGAVNTQRI